MFPVALVAVGLVVAVVVVLVAILSSSSGGQGAGPLAAKTGGRSSRIDVAQPAAIGQAISVSGPLIVQNTGDHVLVLDRVELVGLQSGIYRGAYVLPWPPKQTPFTGALSYRVPRDGRALPGATVAPPRLRLDRDRTNREAGPASVDANRHHLSRPRRHLPPPGRDRRRCLRVGKEIQDALRHTCVWIDAEAL